MSEHLPVIWLHSSFRDHHLQTIRPDGLQWNLDGQSHVSYIAEHGPVVDNPETRKAIVTAYNVFAFAKQLPLRKPDDVVELKRTASHHVLVTWKKVHDPEIAIDSPDIFSYLTKIARKGFTPTLQVWINGRYIDDLSTETLPLLQRALKGTPSVRLRVKRSKRFLRIERYFRGMIRGQEVFEHVLDNLYCMEDPEIIDERTFVGTCTLPDWIMGGHLTCRLWIHDGSDGTIHVERPVYKDNVATSDRTFKLRKGDLRMEIFRNEIKRLRFLAALKHPVTENVSDSS